MGTMTWRIINFCQQRETSSIYSICPKNCVQKSFFLHFTTNWLTLYLCLRALCYSLQVSVRCVGVFSRGYCRWRTWGRRVCSQLWGGWECWRSCACSSAPSWGMTSSCWLCGFLDVSRHRFQPGRSWSRFLKARLRMWHFLLPVFRRNYTQWRDYAMMRNKQ